MKIYLYCSYTHSKRGFVLSQLIENDLVSVSLSTTENPGEMLVNHFFTYDAFRVLWQEYPEENSFPILPKTGGTMFGIRGLRGPLEDRTGIINFALLADKDEQQALSRIAEGILESPENFALGICQCLSIGGPCGYTADGAAMKALLNALQEDHTQSLRETKIPIVRSVRDMLKFAVYVGSWEQAAAHLRPRWIWKICPKQALSQEEFALWYGKNMWQ